MLEQEREFFDSDTRDKLKVPPFTKVKRIPRDYTNEEQIVLKYKHQRDLEERAKQQAQAASSVPSQPVSDTAIPRIDAEAMAQKKSDLRKNLKVDVSEKN